MRERVTLTIDSEILKQIDDSIDGHKVKNRSHAVELLLKSSLGTKMPKKALILAGGNGNPLKFMRKPHALAPIKGLPVIEHVIALLKKFGITQIVIPIHKKLSNIKTDLEKKDLGVELIFVDEPHALGTAGPIRLTKDYFKTAFFVANADELKNINLLQMFEFHKEHKGLITIALTTVDDPSNYGVANLTGYHILNFIEKPKRQNAPSNLINAGLYIMEPEAIEYIPEGFAELETDVFPKLAKENKLMGYAFSGQWFALDSVKDHKRANKLWKGPQ